ncbi:SEFIR domain-containing protein [Vallitalea guaymasensis]|uniref:SEFIR domain-containing protein n=1 Tax=Vallitalea guaymasensis TaxID=1185412 RepID=UPI0023573D88|nr:SEFIR domain-containing protein [Vallitalea guaymasensis]
MSKIAIEHPKVFISYAWGSEEYQAKVLSLATDLVNDGIDVQFDKWSLKEGNDTYAFMERCVADTSITNVLILLDEQYSIKANLRSGGVGTETQIISAEIYNKTKQEKFIPIIFERGQNDEVYKPVYLNGLLHFDLSISERYDDEYQRLVKRLYGIEIYQKPELGKKPLWLESKSTVSTKKRSAYSVLKTNLPEKARIEQFISFLTQIKDKIIDYMSDKDLKSLSMEEYISTYAGTRPIRDEFLQLINYVSFVKDGEQYISNMLENTLNNIKIEDGLLKEIKLTLIHELFIYVIAIFYKHQNYEGLAYIFGKTYFANDYSGNAGNFNIFYSINEKLDNAVSKRDDKKYYSGTAQFWVENIATEICSKDEFVFADLLCYNYAVFGKEYKDYGFWFPITYPYCGYDKSMIRTFAIRLKSLEHLSKLSQIFGYNEIRSLTTRISEIEERIKTGVSERYRYNTAFDSAPMICDYIKSVDLGTLK